MQKTFILFNLAACNVTEFISSINFEEKLLVSFLVVLVIADYVTGMISAFFNGKLESKIGFQGIAKKIFIFVMVVIGEMLDKLLPINGSSIENSICLFYIVNEALSILENAGEMGVPLPKSLKDAIERLSKKE